MCIIDCLSTIVFILPLHLDYTKVIILILWWRNFQLEYWRTFQLVSTLYVVYLLYAIASIVAIIGALQIYIKMNTGEGDVTKSIMMLVGACLFMIGATIIFPAFFGYNIV
ncbi:DUF4134 domain-containing protein [Bacteroides vulgatus]|nr:DUF4134 domain-containing protein [Phocaeicola vulgatus]NMX18453.1 DUF4134 domain-containing protein [Phocaeicola vulgatus]